MQTNNFVARVGTPISSQVPLKVQSANHGDAEGGSWLMSSLFSKLLNINAVALLFIEMLVRFSYLAPANTNNEKSTLVFSLNTFLMFPLLLLLLVAATFRLSPSLFKYCMFLENRFGLGMY